MDHHRSGGVHRLETMAGFVKTTLETPNIKRRPYNPKEVEIFRQTFPKPPLQRLVITV